MGKKALVISGGGSKGAYAVGAIKYMVDTLRLNFDIVIGTSTGSLIAPFVISNKIIELEDFYSHAGDYGLVEKKPAFQWRRAKSIYKTTGLRIKLKEFLDNQLFETLTNSQNNMLICTVDFVTGKIVNFYTGPDLGFSSEQYELKKIANRDTLVNAVHASADMPVLTPLLRIQGGLYADGGVKEIIPVWPAIDMGATDIYAIILSSKEKLKNPKDWKDKDNLSLETIALRTLGLILDEIRQNDIHPALLHSRSSKYINKIAKIEKGLAEMQSVLKNQHSISQPDLDQLWSKYFKFPSIPSQFPSSDVVSIKIIQPEKEGDLPLDTLEFKNSKMVKMIKTGFDQAKTQLA